MTTVIMAVANFQRSFLPFLSENSPPQAFGGVVARSKNGSPLAIDLIGREAVTARSCPTALWRRSQSYFLLPLLAMALASVLERPLPVNQHGFFGLGGRADLLDLGPGSPGDGLSLAAPSWGVPEEPKIEMLHGTTTLAFKVLSRPPCGSRLSGIPAGTEAGGGSVLSSDPWRRAERGGAGGGKETETAVAEGRKLS